MKALLRIILLCLFGGRLAGQALEFVPARLELGRVAQNSLVASDIRLWNRSNAALQVEQISADCGCTTSKLESPLLAPGQATTLHVTFDSRHFVGKLVRHVQVLTNQGSFSLPIEVSVAQYLDWDVSPLPLILPPSLISQSASTELRLTYLGPNKAVAITSILSSQPWLEAALLPASGGGGPALIKLTKHVSAPPGTHTVSLEVATDEPGGKPLQLNVLVPVASGLSVAPSPVVLPRVKAGELSRASFRILGWTDAAPPVVTCDRGTVVYQGAVHQEHSFEVALRAAPVGTTLATIRIFRGDQLQQEVSAVLATQP